jgi:hypothetical protein
MAHEIFIEPELESLQDETNASEWFEICSQLGLDKQLSLASKSETKKAPPYMFCDPKTKKIIEILCPCKVKLMDYQSSTIPIDVMKEIQKCKEHGWYENFEIFYDNQSPDPFVLGVLPNEYEWRADRHLIARWGPELLPFELLEEKAIARVKDIALKELSQVKHALQYAIDNPESYIRGLLAGSDKFRMPAERGTNSDSFPF